MVSSTLCPAQHVLCSHYGFSQMQPFELNINPSAIYSLRHRRMDGQMLTYQQQSLEPSLLRDSARQIDTHRHYHCYRSREREREKERKKEGKNRKKDGKKEGNKDGKKEGKKD